MLAAAEPAEPVVLCADVLVELAALAERCILRRRGRFWQHRRPTASVDVVEIGRASSYAFVLLREIVVASAASPLGVDRPVVPCLCTILRNMSLVILERWSNGRI